MAHLNLPPAISLLRSITKSNDYCEKIICMIEGDIFDNIYLYHIYRYTYMHTSNTYIFQTTYGQKSSMKLKNSIHQLTFPKISMRQRVFPLERFFKMHKKNAVQILFLCKTNPITRLKMAQKSTQVQSKIQHPLRVFHLH